MTEPRCSKCGVVKAPENTAKMASASDGYQSHCRLCKGAYGSAWRAANAKQHRARLSAWRRANSEKHNAYQAAWCARNPEGVREKSTRRRARLAGAFVEDVSRLVLIERDDGVCGICGLDVDPLDYHVDHVIPLSRGGEHSYRNTQIAHPRCNVRKSFKSSSDGSQASTSSRSNGSE